MSGLHAKHCLACEGGVKPLTSADKTALLTELNNAWNLNKAKNELKRTIKFKNYYETMSFVNAVAWMAHQENHHPDLVVSYQECVITYTTHAVKDVSENDFICAAKVDQILT